MSQILLGALLVALAMSRVAWAEQRLPVFDVRPECRAVASVMPVQKCLEDEQSARVEQRQKLGSFSLDDVLKTLQTAPKGGN